MCKISVRRTNLSGHKRLPMEELNEKSNHIAHVCIHSSLRQAQYGTCDVSIAYVFFICVDWVQAQQSHLLRSDGNTNRTSAHKHLRSLAQFAHKQNSIYHNMFWHVATTIARLGWQCSS